ncbi:MAG TPA: RNase adapter RapZ [Trueperaceae bacterium]|nr:RNase adapter RapZ [Trueperaceae bacterium]
MSPPLVILTGVSGSGKSTALHALEDIGFYTVDNLPPSLWPELIDLVEENNSKGLAIGIDIRARQYLAAAPGVIRRLEAVGHDPVVLFLDASDDTLVRRYNFTRRTHPISQGTLTADLAAERLALEPLRALADEVIDTTLTSARSLTQALWDRFTDGNGFLLRLISFGYKRGLPTDVDVVFDVRGMPNPFYDELLRPLPGTDERVQSYVFTPEALETYSQLRSLIKTLAHQAAGSAGRSAYTVAIGCTGGQHRSVAVAERLSHDLADGLQTVVQHRDLERAMNEHRSGDHAPAGVEP